MTPDPQICSSGFPEEVKRYIDPKTLRWRFSSPQLDFRTEHFIVGTNLILCAVYDFTNGKLVCFPERHINWKATGYIGWFVTASLGNLPCNSKIWKRHASRIATALRDELKRKGIDGPKDRHTTPQQQQLSLGGSYEGGYPDEQIPHHAFTSATAASGQVLRLPWKKQVKKRTKPIKTVISDNDDGQ